MFCRLPYWLFFLLQFSFFLTQNKRGGGGLISIDIKSKLNKEKCAVDRKENKYTVLVSERVNILCF